jgi:Fe-S-cluster containining protein
MKNKPAEEFNNHHDPSRIVPYIKEDFPSFSITKQTPIEHVLKLGKDCERCGHCCSYGSGYFLDEDIEIISRSIGIQKETFIKEFLEEHEVFNTKIHKAKLNRQKNRPYGSCIFFEPEKGCTIHNKKPLHCSIAKGCGEHGQALSIWFTLNYLVNPTDPESIRQWASYLKTHPTIPGGELRDLIKDERLLKEILNYQKLK